jgi:hypothetical protein
MIAITQLIARSENLELKRIDRDTSNPRGEFTGLTPIPDGRYWARTSDLLLVRQALSQLS